MHSHRHRRPAPPRLGARTHGRVVRRPAPPPAPACARLRGVRTQLLAARRRRLALQQLIVMAPSDETEVRLKVGGMKCAGCQAAVAKALEAVDGVQTVKVTLDPGSAVVRGPADPTALVAAVEGTGKTAVLLGKAANAAVTASSGAAFTPLSAAEQLVQLVNCGCLFGWLVVGMVVLARLSGRKVGAMLPLFPTLKLDDGPTVWCSGPLALNDAGELEGWNVVSSLVVILEILCCVEVIRMLIGAQPSVTQLHVASPRQWDSNRDPH